MLRNRSFSRTSTVRVLALSSNMLPRVGFQPRDASWKEEDARHLPVNEGENVARVRLRSQNLQRPAASVD